MFTTNLSTYNHFIVLLFDFYLLLNNLHVLKIYLSPLVAKHYQMLIFMVTVCLIEITFNIVIHKYF